jgi:Ribbon-helix-helix protein, copG family
MHKTQIYLDAELDAALRDEAALRSVSRAELIRTLLRAQLATVPREVSGGLDDLVGALDIEPFDIDEVVYGPKG